MHRVLNIDVLTCPKCAAAMVTIAFITDPSVLTRILDHLNLPSAPPRLAPARSPLDEQDLFADEEGTGKADRTLRWSVRPDARRGAVRRVRRLLNRSIGKTHPGMTAYRRPEHLRNTDGALRTPGRKAAFHAIRGSSALGRDAPVCPFQAFNPTAAPLANYDARSGDP